MIVSVHDIDIECPDVYPMIQLVESLEFHQARQLHIYQKQPKKWADQYDIPEYCLYLGSMDGERGAYDLYHYESFGSYPHYSTAIVYGNRGGDYISGWPEIAAKNNRDHYKELMKREYHCGLLTVDDLIRIGISTLGIGYSEHDVIRPMRETFKLKRPDMFEAEYREPRFDFWDEMEGAV